MYRTRIVLAAATAALVSLALASSAAAATVQVNTTADQSFQNDVNCSLREAIQVTNADLGSANGCNATGTLGADTITFAPSLNGSTLNLTAIENHELLVTDSDGVTITGPGAGLLAISAPPSNRVIESTGGVPLSISGVTIENGSVSDTTASGGGIRAAGDLTLNHVVVTGNTATATASGSGDAFAGGGGIDATNGTVTINNSQITNNSATADNPLAAGNDGDATAQGGGVFLGTGTVSNTTISANTASATDEHASVPGTEDNAHAFGAGIAGVTLTLDHSTVSANLATGAAPEGGAGDGVIGGGVFTNGATGAIELSTITGNQTSVDSNGADIGGGIGTFAALTVDSTTVAGNGPASGDSASANLWPNAPITIKNTIVANPRGAGSSNCSPTVTSQGFNIDDGTSCGLDPGTTPSDQEGVNPQLGALADNGGPTETMLPGSTSPAIDAGSATGQSDATHDQRGLTRPVNSATHTDSDDGSDIGAVEAQAPALPTVTGTSPASPSSTITTPNVQGTLTDAGAAEGASSVFLFSSNTCATQVGTGTTTAFTGAGIQGTATPNATTTFYARGRNAYGINSTCSTTFASYTHDSLPPSLSIDSGPTGPTNVPRPTFGFTAEGGSTVVCSIDTGTPSFGACSGASSHQPPTNLADGGPYTFRVKATDAAGNLTTLTRSFSIDTDPPSVSVDSGPSGATTNARPTFDFTPTGSSSVQCSIDTGAPSFGSCSAATSHQPATNLADGPYTFRVKVSDAAGNTATQTRSFAVDVSPPSLTIDSGPTDPTDHTPTFTFHATDLDPPVAFTCSIDGGTPQPCTSPFTAGQLPDGSHTFHLSGQDALLNPASSTSQAFTITTPVTAQPQPTPPKKKKCKKAKKGMASAAKKCKKKK